MAKPGRFIQTTLVYEDKAASFIFVEGMDGSALVEFFQRGRQGMDAKALEDFLRWRRPFRVVYKIRRPEFSQPRRPPLRPTEIERVMALAVKVIEDPFMRSNEPILDKWLNRAPDDEGLRWVEALLQSESVIITRSPPVQSSFESLAKIASGAAMGTWVGHDVANALGQPLLMFLTVPAGILICSATTGIGKAWETGLYEWMLEKMGRAPEKPPHRPPPSASKRRTASPKGKAKR